MVTTTPPHRHIQNQQFLFLQGNNKKQLVTFAVYALMALAILHYILFYPIPIITKKTSSPASKHQEVTISVTASSSQARQHNPKCNYADGHWVQDPNPPLYNGSSCSYIKDAQNCMPNGRPDTGYLYWRWQPVQCELPAFSPLAFLNSMQHKHIAFVGDSMARNQVESLICLLNSFSKPQLVYAHGQEESKSRRWHFEELNVTVSIYWSPFLVKVEEKSANARHNNVFLDAFDDRWLSELEDIDVVVFSVGHWFLLSGIYHDNNALLGCHDCPEFNHTEIGFFDVFREGIRRTLYEVGRRQTLAMPVKQRVIVVTTFSQAHFVGNWDKAGTCSRQEPYKEGETEMEYTVKKLRKTVVEEVAAAAAARKGNALGMRYETLDVTRLAMLRPDGHPGPYMYKDPFAGGAERVQNDCVHWCLPGPIDTFNQILLQLI